MQRAPVLLVLLLAPAFARGADPQPDPQAPATAQAEGAPATGAATSLMGPDDCVRVALRDSGRVRESEAKVAEWKGRLAEVEAVFYPKLTGTTYIAPTPKVTGGPFEEVTTDYTQWGPYTHLEAVLAQPLYAFGRGAAGERAATERMRVEEARVRQTENALALEVRTLYFTHLYAKSIRPALESARKILDSALKTAQEEYESGSGKVTNVDVQKLLYGSSQLDVFRTQARHGAELSLDALKHTMALPQEADLLLADEVLPDAPTDPIPGLAELFVLASEARPEWAQLRHGHEAALSLAKAERLANAPVLFAAGQIRADWAPVRDSVDNPYFYDPFNQLTGGVAVGLRFDMDPAKAAARAEQAEAIGEQVDALAAFASTGIPLEVRKARGDLVQASEVLGSAENGAVASRKWMLFAGAAFASGTGEAQDLLEGLVAYLSAKKTHYEALRDVHVAHAYLQYATGRSLDEPAGP